MVDPFLYPATDRIVTSTIEMWPEHAGLLRKSFSDRGADLMISTERHAAMILRIVDHRKMQIRDYCGDYQYLCDKVLEEELFFRRTGQYRLSRFEDANREVYSNAEFMSRYMNFLLLTHVLWDNHARALQHFEQKYLPSLPAGTNHLEIGPGHGLLLHLAKQSPNVARVTGWDVSETSIGQTRECLDAMGQSDVTLRLQNLFDAAPSGGAHERFDSVVLAEVLEHLEDPATALRSVARHMKPGGLLWVHVPINSPAPDHLYLLRSPEEATALLRSGGFEVIDSAFFPMSGQTLARAVRIERTISAVLSARNAV